MAIVTNYTIYQNNPYHQLIYSEISDRFEPVKGAVADALERLQTGTGNIFHVHWEEHAIRKCQTRAEASAAASYLLDGIDEFRGNGGILVWTVHNGAPHELEHADIFLQLRRGVMERADRILVHNLESMNRLDEQGELDRSRVFLLPHASYLGVYEDEDRVRVAKPSGRPTALCFGMVRRYKAYERLLDRYVGLSKSKRIFDVKIAGAPLANDTYGSELHDAYGSVPGVDLDLEAVDDADVMPLLRTATCLVLPHERFLTSGSALLGLSAPLPIIAPASAQMRELLPPDNHDLLFDPNNADDMIRAITQVCQLDSDEWEMISNANLKRAQYFHPRRISRLLGNLYASLQPSAPN
jgi:glycosyltransferase involved in cell wall biosynthesis